MDIYLFGCILLLVIFMGIYFIPSLFAHERKHSKRTAIFVLNLTLGWIIFGWIAALIWAFTEDNRPKKNEEKSESEKLADLETLSDLKERCIITEEEFEQKKKKILDLE